eukprot:311642-Pleurochrysis_carterae.AAC.2
MATVTVATRTCLLVPLEFRRGALGVALSARTRARLLCFAWLFHFGLGFGEQRTPIWAVKFEIALDLPRLRISEYVANGF